MAWHLFRLGRWSFRRRRLVAGLWVVLLLLLAVGAGALSGKTNDDFELGGVESTEAFALINERSPDAGADGATARIVFEAPPGQRLADDRRAVLDALDAVRTDQVTGVVDPFAGGTVSADGRVGYATVSYAVPGIELGADDVDVLEAAAGQAEDTGLRVAIGGDAIAPETEPPLAEVVGVGVAVVVLALTFGSLLAAGMPLVTALIGVGVGVLGITTLTGFVELSSVTPALGTMLGLAVGIDYALFIMSRYRSELLAGREPEEAAGRAVGTAGSAVVFAGLTVVIALVGLSVCGIAFLTQMGLAAAGMVVLAVLIALTLLPALLGFVGPRVLGRRARRERGSGAAPASTRTAGRRWAELVRRHRVLALVAGIGAAVVVSIPVASLELALPDDGIRPAGTDSRVAYDLIAENFGAGANGPLVVVVDTAGAPDTPTAIQSVVDVGAELRGLATGGDSDVAAVLPPVPGTGPKAAAALEQTLDAVQLATFTVIPTSGPSDAATKDLVADIRAAVAGLPEQTGARALVTGQTAVGVDISDELQAVFPLYLAVVVGLAFLLLVLVFRSLLVPLKAALGFLLSVGVALGSTVAVFQWGWLAGLIGVDVTSPVLFLLPLLLTGILFGLAMDYEVFLVTRMREAWVHGTPARDAVVEGFAHSARVVAAAAVIMTGVFAGFALADDVILKTIGFALAVGVLADAFLVRMTLVPALMMLVGERIWWLPRWLDRVLPEVDVEGEGLARRLDAEQTARDGKMERSTSVLPA